MLEGLDDADVTKEGYRVTLNGSSSDGVALRRAAMMLIRHEPKTVQSSFAGWRM